MNMVILFIVICLAVYLINWAANTFYEDLYDIDELEAKLVEEEDKNSSQTKQP